MTKVEKFLKKLEEDRPKILSSEVRAYAISLTKNKQKAKAFLREGGIIDKNGKLTSHYR